MRKAYLKDLEKEELIKLLVELSRLHEENRAFLEARLLSDYTGLFQVACEKIQGAFSSFESLSLKDARQALYDFRKANPDNAMLIDLYRYYIQKAYELEKTDWRFQESFYSAIERVFGMIIDILKEDPSLKERYHTALMKIISQANEGWNHKDTLKDMYEELV